MKLSIIELRQICDLILTRLEKSGFKEIDVDFDYYRDFDDKYELDEDCPKLMIGSFIEDWEWLEKILNGENPVTPLDFSRLGNVIKIVGDEVDRSKNPFFLDTEFDKKKD